MKKFVELSNGVFGYILEVENDFTEAQNIFNHACATENIDVECAYNERVEKYSNQFVGTYKVKVERKGDYKEFKDMLEYFVSGYHREEKRKFSEMYYNGEITQEEYHEKYIALSDCTTCDIHSIKYPSFEEWKAGMIEYDEYNEYIGAMKTRKMKLGKYLQKMKVPQSIIDFYSQQVKEEKEMFITISDKVQHIAGMSYYAKLGSWNGFNGTSCQDTRHDGEHCIHLAGALYDDRLFVAMLHEKLDDIENMENKLMARTLMKPVDFEGNSYLVPLKYYGNNTTKNMLHNALNQLKEIGIYSRDVKYERDDSDEIEYISTPINGGYEMYECIDVHICETIDEYVNVECPMCGGSGEYEASFYDRNDYHHYKDIECPACNGSGEIEVNAYVDVDEWEEIEIEETVYFYDDEEKCYLKQYRNTFEVCINKTMLRDDREKYNNYTNVSYILDMVKSE